MALHRPARAVKNDAIVRPFRLLPEQVNMLMRSALLVASMLCGLAFAPAHAEHIIQLAQAAPAQPAG
ncbi:MAG TPA: hypothetical protein DHH36_13895, partial [Afipia sp.]|nr:hypothetical protein [Afipia sp.]